MSEVTLQIDGKHYTVACAQGQEAQVERLAGVIEAKLKQLGSNLSVSPAQNLVFAALLLADELDEARSGSSADPGQDPALQESQRTIEQLKLELEALRTEHDETVRDLAIARQAESPPAPDNSADQFADIVEKLATSLEDCATKLEDASAAP